MKFKNIYKDIKTPSTKEGWELKKAKQLGKEVILEFKKRDIWTGKMTDKTKEIKSKIPKEYDFVTAKKGLSSYLVRDAPTTTSLQLKRKKGVSFF